MTWRLLWRNTNNELLPVYDRQLCESEFVTQIRGKSFPSNFSDELRFEWNQKPLIIAQAFTTSIAQIWVKPSGIPQIWVNPQIWAITQNWGNHAEITQNWVLHLFLRVVIYLFNVIPVVDYIFKLLEYDYFSLSLSLLVGGLSVSSQKWT